MSVRILALALLAATSLLSTGCQKKPAEPAFAADPLDTITVGTSVLEELRAGGHNGLVVSDSAVIYESPAGAPTAGLCFTGDFVNVTDAVDTTRGGSPVTMFKVRQEQRNLDGWVRGRDLHLFDEYNIGTGTYLWSTYVPTDDQAISLYPSSTYLMTFTPEFFERCMRNDRLAKLAPRVMLANGGGFAVVLRDSTAISRVEGGDTILNAGERVIAAIPQMDSAVNEPDLDVRVVLLNGTVGMLSCADLYQFREDSWNEYTNGTAIPPDITLKGTPAANAERLFSQEFLARAARNESADFWYSFKTRYVDGGGVLEEPADQEDQPSE